MGTYSNGWGHLIVTLAILAMSTFLLYVGKLDSSAIAGLLGSVVSFWFMSGSVNRFAAQTAAAAAQATTAANIAAVQAGKLNDASTNNPTQQVG